MILDPRYSSYCAQWKSQHYIEAPQGCPWVSVSFKLGLSPDFTTYTGMELVSIVYFSLSLLLIHKSELSHGNHVLFIFESHPHSHLL